MKNKAIVISGVKQLSVEELPMPEISSNEVLYEVHATSLCTVEQRSYLGAKAFGYPLLGGHENSGVVVAVGSDVREYKVGDRITATYGYCGECVYCKTGRGTACLNGRKAKKRVDFNGIIIGGSLASYLAVPAIQCCKLPEDADFEKLMNFQIDRATKTYVEALALLPQIDQKNQKVGLIMGSIYYALLKEIKLDGAANILKYKISIPGPRKKRIALKTWLFGFKP